MLEPSVKIYLLTRMFPKVITLTIRTPLTKARKGYFKDTQLEGLLVPLLEVGTNTSATRSMH